MERIAKRHYAGSKIADYDFGSAEHYDIVKTRAKTWDGLASAINKVYGYEDGDDCYYTADTAKKSFEDGYLIICEDGAAVLYL